MGMHVKYVPRGCLCAMRTTGKPCQNLVSWLNKVPCNVCRAGNDGQAQESKLVSSQQQRSMGDHAVGERGDREAVRDGRASERSDPAEGLWLPVLPRLPRCDVLCEQFQEARRSLAEKEKSLIEKDQQLTQSGERVAALEGELADLKRLMQDMKEAVDMYNAAPAGWTNASEGVALVLPASTAATAASAAIPPSQSS